MLTSSQSSVTEFPVTVSSSQTLVYETEIAIWLTSVQLSVTSPIIPGTVTSRSPFGASLMVSPVAIKSSVGAAASTTVITAVSEPVLPDGSSTVRVTMFGPKSSQSKSVLLNEYESISQLSVEPSSTSPVVIVAIPVGSKAIVKSCARATGLSLSETVTIRVSVEVLLLISVTVSVTVLVPTSSQSNAV